MAQETHQVVTQAIVVEGRAPRRNMTYERISLFDVNGDPISLTPAAPQTGATVPLTGYAAHAVGNVAAGDSANVAIAKLEARIAALEAA